MEPRGGEIWIPVRKARTRNFQSPSLALIEVAKERKITPSLPLLTPLSRPLCCGYVYDIVYFCWCGEDEN